MEGAVVDGEGIDVGTGNVAGDDTNAHVDATVKAAVKGTEEGASEGAVVSSEGNHEGPADVGVDGTYATIIEGINDDDVDDCGIRDSNDVNGNGIKNVGGVAVMDGASSGTPATEEPTSNISYYQPSHVATKQRPQKHASGKQTTSKKDTYLKKTMELQEAEKKKKNEKMRTRKKGSDQFRTSLRSH